MKKDRINEENLNKFGSKMKIVMYNNTGDILVEFEQGNRVATSYQAFKKGKVKNVYDKVIYGVGFLGEGEYKSSINKSITAHYSVWYHMMRRCYDKKMHEKHPTYKECTVAEEWHNFQNFAKWYDENYYEVNGERMCLDKDIIVKGNKLYSPDTCVFVPQSINNVFTKSDSSRGDLPIGVSYHKPALKYMAYCKNGDGKLIHLGLFNTSEQAYNSYKKYKESVISEIANRYIEYIPLKLYNAMINYIV